MDKGPCQRLVDMGMALRVDGDHTVRIGADGVALVHDDKVQSLVIREIRAPIDQGVSLLGLGNLRRRSHPLPYLDIPGVALRGYPRLSPELTLFFVRPRVVGSVRRRYGN